MTPGRNRLDQIVRGLDGVSTGKWCQFHPHYCEEAIGTSFSDWDTSHDLSAIKDGTRRRIASFKHADDAAHMDRCSPDSIREIAAYVRDLEDRLAKAAEALEAAADQLARAHDDAFKQCAGYGLVTSDGRDFSCLQLNKCGEQASRARTALSTMEKEHD